MSFGRELIQFLSAVSGLAKDLTLDAAKWYGRIVTGTFRWLLIIVLVAAALGLTGLIAESPKFLAAGILLFTLATVVGSIVYFPLVELGAYALELGPGKRLLRRLGFISGWGVFFFLIAYTSPADSSLFNRLLIAVLTFFIAALMMGLESTRKLLGIKLGIILAIITFGVFFPRTNLMMTNVITHVDRYLSEFFDPNFNEVELSLATLDSVKFFASDGEPLYWCRVDRGRPAGYRCFDRDGHDPYNKEKLRPVTPEMLDVIRSQLRAAPSPTLGPRVSQDAPGKPPQSPLNSPVSAPEAALISPSAISAPPQLGRPRWTLVAWDAAMRVDVRIHQDIRQIGAAVGLHPPNPTLQNSFVEQGVAKRILDGDVRPLINAELSQFSDYLVLVEYTAREHTDTAGEPLKAVTGEMRLLIIRLKDMETSQILYVSEGEAGANFRDAGELAYQRLLRSMKPQLGGLLQGFIK